MKTITNKLDLILGGTGEQDLFNMMYYTVDPVSGKSFMDLVSSLPPEYQKADKIHEALISLLENYQAKSQQKEK